MATDHKVDQKTNPPLQTVSHKSKTEKWFKQNVDHFIGRASFNFDHASSGRKNLNLLYDVYNNRFPMAWFTHATDPLSAQKAKHKVWPAKIRPVTILRTNIDLLLGEYPRRPFVYNVSNLGESGYSRYQEKMAEQARAVMMDYFFRGALEEAQAQGVQLTPEQLAKLKEEPPVPEQVKAQFQSSYKDNRAIKAQKYLRRQIQEQGMRRKFNKMFKHWLITGEAYSYKAIENDTMIYREVSPLCLDYDKSHSSDFIEDGDWVVYRDMLTTSDLVDRYYEFIKEQNLRDLEKDYHFHSPQRLYDYLTGGGTGLNARGKHAIYHVQWKGRKKIGFLSYLDMETFQYVEEVVDENYIIDRERGEQVEWRWVNEVHEGWRLENTGGEDIYFGLRICPVQRNEMNNHSTCKLSYNGRKYSDLHSENISVLELGIPFQILYILTFFTLEKTIAKSKGKIVMIDKNTIPDDDEWDEEKFFYYGEAMGYALIDRSKPGVDKTWNQYQVLDMSLFDQIKQLIELCEYFKQQWDDVIGITRQRKGQTYASDGQGVNERSVFQSTVITDMIFLGFEELVQRDLQGIMDLSKFTTSKGVYGLWNDDDFGTTLMEIEPEDFMNEELGVLMNDSSEELRKLNDMKSYAQAMLQNKVKVSTVMEVVDAINIAELKQKVREIERIEMETERMMQQDEFDAQAQADMRAQRMMAYEALLKREHMEHEYDRKEDLETLKGTFNTFTFQDGDANDNNVPDAVEIQKILQGSQKLMAEIDDKRAKRELDREKVKQSREQMEHQFKQDEIENGLKKEKLKIDRKKANKPAAAKKK